MPDLVAGGNPCSRDFIMPRLPAIFLAALLGASLHGQTRENNGQAASGYGAVSDSSASGTVYIFGLGHMPAKAANPRGGSVDGGPVTLAPGRSLPLPEIAATKDAFSRDRAAILALAGDFRVSFHEIETIGLAADYKPPQPYHSWATERVHVVADTGKKISLQHTLVMFFRAADGTLSGPMLQKHWRQDWTYEATALHLWNSADFLERRRIAPAAAAGTWTHSVFNLEDSLRYEATGRWDHRGNVSTWTSERAWRPLPRREHTVRHDYDVVEGVHGVVITPTGWVEERKMWKRATEAGKAVEPPRYLAQETGIDRYERITAPSLAAADDYWKKTDGYWAIVRRVWAEELAKHDRFTIRDEFEGKLSYQHHNEYIKKLDAQPFDPVDAERHVRKTVTGFIAARP
jgi:hypothetical protein